LRSALSGKAREDQLINGSYSVSTILRRSRQENAPNQNHHELESVGYQLVNAFIAILNVLLSTPLDVKHWLN